MYSPVGHQTPCIIPVPSESKMEAVDVERPFGGRTEPHIVVDTSRNFRIGSNGNRTFPADIRPGPDGADPAKFTAMNIFDGTFPVGIAALPLSDLHHTAVFMRSFYHEIALL